MIEKDTNAYFWLLHTHSHTAYTLMHAYTLTHCIYTHTLHTHSHTAYTLTHTHVYTSYTHVHREISTYPNKPLN